MSESEIRNQMMDYLFNEMAPDQKKGFEKILDSRPDLRAELKELRSTSDLLLSAPSVVPDYKPAFLTISIDSDEKKNKNVKSVFSSVIKTLFAVAASVLLILLGLSLTGMEIGQSEQGFYLTFGSPPVQQTGSGITEEQVYDIMEQMRLEQSLLLTSLMEQAQVQQNEHFNEVITLLADYYDERRQQDLIMIADGFEQLEIQTHHRLNRTNAALGDIIYALSKP